MTEEAIIKMAVSHYVCWLRDQMLSTDGSFVSDDQFLSVAKDRVKALIPFIERNHLMCIREVNDILSL